MPSNEIQRSVPHISIVIPVHNGAETLPRCLEAIFGSDFEGYEVILVDDGSTDQSDAIGRTFGCRVIVLETKQGAGNARNQGVRAARAPIVFFTDADVILPSGAIERVWRRFCEHPEIDALQGIYTCPGLHSDIPTRYQNDYYHYYCRRIVGPYTSVFATWCAAARKEAFWNAGGFDPHIAGASVEDEELGYELVERGSRIFLETELRVDHLAHYTIGGFLKRRFVMARNQIKSAFRKAPIRLFSRYANLSKNLTHHSRKILISIPLSFIMTLLLVRLVLIRDLMSLVLLLASLGLFAFLSEGFLRFVARTHGLRAVLPSLGMQWLDMIAVGCGLLVGAVEYGLGRRY